MSDYIEARMSLEFNIELDHFLSGSVFLTV